MLRVDEADENTPAHLIDLSTGGAALLTTAYNAPAMGQRVDLRFETQGNNEDGEPPELRHETGVVMNIASPENGVSRIGVRFLSRHGFASDCRRPGDVLIDHRRQMPAETITHRWNTARNFGFFAKNRQATTTSAV